MGGRDAAIALALYKNGKILVAGQARFADASGMPPLAAADTALLLGAGETRQRFVIDGGGEVLVIRLAMPK